MDDKIQSYHKCKAEDLDVCVCLPAKTFAQRVNNKCVQVFKNSSVLRDASQQASLIESSTLTPSLPASL